MRNSRKSLQDIRRLVFRLRYTMGLVEIGERDSHANTTIREVG